MNGSRLVPGCAYSYALLVAKVSTSRAPKPGLPCTAIVLCLCRLLAGQPVTVTVDTANPGDAIPVDFAGLSYEATSLLADSSGNHLFSETNRALLAMCKTLGIRNLRIGGNSSERATTNPTDADRAALFHFAEAGNINVIFTLRMAEALDGSNPADQAAQVAIANTLIRDFNNNIQALEFANEPDHLMSSPTAPDHPRVTYPAYTAMVLAYLAGITAGPMNAVLIIVLL